MQLAEVLVQWSGTPVVGGGVNVLYFAADSGVPDPAAIRAAYDAMKTSLPPSVTIQVAGSGNVIEDTTGVLQSVWSGTTPTAVTGTSGAAQSAAGVGACVNWLTGGIVNGRKLRGRTFLVPLSVGSYDDQGTLESATVTRLNSFAAAMMASGPLAVWHRPTTAGGSDGNSYGVISHTVRDHVAFLGSRRD